MKSTMRLPLLILAWSLCAAAPQSSWAAEQFGPVDGQGADPLLDAYPFFIFPNSTRIAQIVFERDDRTLPPVPMTLDVQCCTDFALGAPVRPAGVTFEAVAAIEQLPGPSAPSGARHGPPRQHDQPILRPNQFYSTPRVAQMVGLKVTTGASPQSGRYVATITARDPSYSRSTQVIVNVLPPLVESVTPSCGAFTTAMVPSEVPWGPLPAGASLVPTDPLVPLVKPLFDAKAAMSSQATASLGPVTWNAAGSHAMQFTLSKSNIPLSPTQAWLGFVNSTRDDKQFIAFNSAMCVPVFTSLLKSGDSAALLADTLTTTILLRRSGSGGWENVSVLSAPQLWTLFGGRTVSFDWRPSASDP